MRKIIAGLFMSLDGVMESPETWSGPYMNDEVGQVIGTQMAAIDALLLGRVTYETFARSFAGGTDPMSRQMSGTRKYVVSSSLHSAEWENSTLIAGDVAGEVSRLKRQEGREIGMSGSATLVRWLLRNRLLDELRLIVPPIVVGSGRRLFDGSGDPLPLRLIGSRALSNGVLSLTYASAEPAPQTTGE